MLYRLSYSRILVPGFKLSFELETLNLKLFLWGEQDSNLRRRTSSELQSDPVGHFGISPKQYFQNVYSMSRISDSNWGPRDYKSRALANWANSAFIHHVKTPINDINTCLQGTSLTNSGQPEYCPKKVCKCIIILLHYTKKTIYFEDYLSFTFSLTLVSWRRIASTAVSIASSKVSACFSEKR